MMTSLLSIAAILTAPPDSLSQLLLPWYLNIGNPPSIGSTPVAQTTPSTAPADMSVANPLIGTHFPS